MPDWSSWDFWAKDIAPIAGGAVGLILLAIRTSAVNRSAKAAQEQAETAAERHEQQTIADRERRITESFAKAVEQLGNDKLEIRLGGIYTLERIARESERDYWPIMETLTAYVRKRAPWPPPRRVVAKPFVELQGGGNTGDETVGGEGASKPETETESAANLTRPATDIQAVLTVLGRRDVTARQQDQAAGRRLDLRRTDLRGAHLEEAHLERANLEEACLEGARLGLVHLEDAILSKVHLEGAIFLGAHLEGAWLQGAKNFPRKQVNTVTGDARTCLPEGLTRPAHWLKTEDEEQPGAQQ